MGNIAILISANAEWNIVREEYSDADLQQTPFGEIFASTVMIDDEPVAVQFVHGGWGKIAAAASAQYVIDRWQPELLINLGTCGGFEGLAQKGDIVLANKTIVYDIIEQMGDATQAIADYTTVIGLSWLPNVLPPNVQTGLLLSADKDVVQSELVHLKEHFAGRAADWESGAIAWTAVRNNTPVLILRGVSDIISETHAEAYGGPEVFEAATRDVMRTLLAQLPFWLSAWPSER